MFILATLFAVAIANAQITKVLTLEGQYYPYVYAGYQQGIAGRTYNSAEGPQYFNGSFRQNQYMDYSMQDLLENCFIYEFYVDNSNTLGVRKYNESYDLIENKIVARNIPTFDNYVIYSTSIYAKLFNDNADYEVLVIYSLEDNATTSAMSIQETRNIQYKMILVDKTGNVLCDFGTAWSFGTANFLVYYNEKWFYSIIRYNYNFETSNGEYTTDVYQIQKQSMQGLSPVSSAQMPAYPNPAICEINIPTPNSQDVNIYDMSGRLVESRIGNGDVVNVNVSGYPSGNYIYQTQGNSGVFIKK